MTHERYLEEVGKDFDGVIPAIFTDDPRHTHKQVRGFAAEQTDVEWCYLLGDFGVQLCGEHRELVSMQKQLGFGLVHYGGNVTYEIPVKTTGGELKVTVPHYAGTAIRVELNNKSEQVAYQPYSCSFNKLPAASVP